MHFLKNLLANHLSRELKELYLSSIILRFALSALYIFEPIYFLKIGLSIGQIILYQAGLYLLYFFLLPIGGKLARLHGYEHVMSWSSPFLIIYLIALYIMPFNKIFILVALVSAVLYKSLYWPGFHADFAKFGQSHERGREISLLVAILTSVGVFGPIFGGWVITVAGWQILFVIIGVFILLSSIPMLTTPERFQPVNFSYKEAMREVFAKKNRSQTLAFIGYSEDLIFGVIWPIFIATVVKNLFTVGALISASTLVNVLIILLIGNFIDKHARLRIERFGSILTAFVWLGASLIKSAGGIFVFDNLYRISRHILGTSLMSIIYDEAKNSSVMKVMIFREMGLAFGKVLGALIVFLIWTMFPDRLNILFVLAGSFSLFYLLLKERAKPDGLVVPPTQPDTTIPIK